MINMLGIFSKNKEINNKIKEIRCSYSIYLYSTKNDIETIKQDFEKFQSAINSKIKVSSFRDIFSTFAIPTSIEINKKMYYKALFCINSTVSSLYKNIDEIRNNIKIFDNNIKVKIKKYDLFEELAIDINNVDKQDLTEILELYMKLDADTKIKIYNTNHNVTRFSIIRIIRHNFMEKKEFIKLKLLLFSESEFSEELSKALAQRNGAKDVKAEFNNVTHHLFLDENFEAYKI